MSRVIEGPNNGGIASSLAKEARIVHQYLGQYIPLEGNRRVFINPDKHIPGAHERVEVVLYSPGLVETLHAWDLPGRDPNEAYYGKARRSWGIRSIFEVDDPKIVASRMLGVLEEIWKAFPETFAASEEALSTKVVPVSHSLDHYVLKA